MKTKLILFDCDGTLYRQPDLPFLQMPFWSEIRMKSIDLYSRLKGCSKNSAEQDFEALFSEYRGEVSKAFEDICGIPSKEYFENTWGEIRRKEYVREPTMRRSTIEQILDSGFEVGLLTNAPRIWAEHVLAELRLSEYFEGRIWDGEGEIRKPFAASYLTVIRELKMKPEDSIMVGDEEKNDIVGSLGVGMNAIRVNPYKKQTRAYLQVSDVNDITAVLK